MKIVFPEYHNDIIKTALATYQNRIAKHEVSSLDQQPLDLIEPIEAANLETACALIKSGAAETMIAGIDYSSRDVILACRDQFGMGNFAADLGLSNPALAPKTFGVPISTTPYTTFSGLAVMQSTPTKNFADTESTSTNNLTDEQSPQVDKTAPKTYLLSDMAACKHPTVTQMTEIIEQTYASARHILADEPRIALLSFSTNGSGGKDPSIDLWREVLADFQNNHADIKIDGEMQLDAAINPAVGQKKFPNSAVAGNANVLIAPDLNSGNLLYKCFEQIAGYTVAGPILQGFNLAVSDLSRGSTVADVMLTIEVITRLAKARSAIS